MRIVELNALFPSNVLSGILLKNLLRILYRASGTGGLGGPLAPQSFRKSMHERALAPQSFQGLLAVAPSKFFSSSVGPAIQVKNQSSEQVSVLGIFLHE